MTIAVTRHGEPETNGIPGKTARRQTGRDSPARQVGDLQLESGVICPMSSLATRRGGR